MPPKAKALPLNTEAIRDVSERVYRTRIGDRDAAQMEVEKPGSVRRNAACMDVLTRVYMEALGIELPRMTETQ